MRNEQGGKWNILKDEAAKCDLRTKFSYAYQTGYCMKCFQLNSHIWMLSTVYNSIASCTAAERNGSWIIASRSKWN